jgi:hypothetical protein
MFSKLLQFFLFVVLVNQSLGGLPGGWSDIPCTEAENEVQFAANSIVEATQTSVLHFVECVSAKRQVVAGYKYNIVLLFSIAANPAEPRGLLKTVTYKVFLYRDLANKLSVTSFQQIIPQSDRVLHKNKCMPGGRCDHVIDAKMIEIAKFAVSKISEKEKKEFSFVEILKLQTQVVNGLKMYFTLKVNLDGKDHKYNAEVYEDFNNTKTLVRYSEIGPMVIDGLLNRFGGSDPLMGGWSPLNMNIEFNKVLLYDASQFAFAKMQKELVTMLQFVNAENAYEQVVNGLNLRFNLICTSAVGRRSYAVRMHVTPGDAATRQFTLNSYKQLYGHPF